MQLSVRCRCNVTRQLDPAKVGPWRLRCKQCGDVLYDPTAAAPVALDPFGRPTPSAPPPAQLSASGRLRQPATPEDDTEFQKRLLESAELKVMMSSDGEEALPCPRHRSKPVVAACTRCGALLCKACLDRIGDEFVCAECIAQVATGSTDAAAQGGVMAFFRKLFGGK